MKVKLAIGFLGTAEMAGYELDLAFLVIALFLAVNGSKQWAIDNLYLIEAKTTINLFL